MFVAVWPPAEVIAAIRVAAGELDASSLRPVPPQQWHLTLRFLGEVGVPSDAARAMGAAADTLPASVIATLGPATDCFGSRVLFVPAGGLSELAAWATTATVSVGEPPEPLPFRGHLTLARARRRGVDLRPFCGRPMRVSWRVEDVTLVASIPGRAGGTYEVLQRLRLGVDVPPDGAGR